MIWFTIREVDHKLAILKRYQYPSLAAGEDWFSRPKRSQLNNVVAKYLSTVNISRPHQDSLIWEIRHPLEPAFDLTSN